MLPPFDFNDVREKLSAQFRPWQRSFRFWVRAVDIYIGYKVFQLRVCFEKDVQKQEIMWERQHELAAEKIYAMCADLGGFFLKGSQTWLQLYGWEDWLYFVIMLLLPHFTPLKGFWRRNSVRVLMICLKDLIWNPLVLLQLPRYFSPLKYSDLRSNHCEKHAIIKLQQFLSLMIICLCI